MEEHYQRLLPAAWINITLGDVAEFEMGQAPPGDACNTKGTGTVFVKAGEFGPRHPIEREWTTTPLKFGRQGDVFMCVVGATCGKLNLGIDCAIGRSVAAIRPKNNIDTLFIYYQLQMRVLELRASSSGSAQGVISKTDLQRVPFLLAPCSEQRRIVAKIEELFSDLDAGVAALERAKANLKRYRAAVLKSAVEGKLTETWRAEHPDVEPASVLLEHILAERRRRWEAEQLAGFEAKGKTPPKDWQEKYKEPVAPDTKNLPELPEGWCWATVAQVGEVQLGRQRAPKYHYGDNMRPYLRVANVFEDRIDTSDVMQMDFSPEEFETYKLHTGDILLNEGQSLELVGRPAMYRDEVPGACFTNTLVRFRAYPGLLQKFALKVFLSYLHSGEFQRIASITVNIAHLGAGRFASLPFPLSPLLEQEEIVKEVERHESVVRSVDSFIQGSLARGARLRQSILKRAFEGKLMPQDPSDEPASILLDRIDGKPTSPNSGEVAKPKSRRGRKQQTELSFEE